MIWTLPNILTLLRLFAAPLLVLAVLLLPRPYADIVAVLLFVGASATDWIDGYLARKWDQTSKLGTMLDPIADKAMVAVALLILVTYSSLNFLILLPAALILFREVFVSGLREYLGDTAGTLKVTQLAKWKTTVQMVAISALLAQGIFEHYVVMRSWGMDGQIIAQIMAGGVSDDTGLRGVFYAMRITGDCGLWLLWLAAVLTVVTGVDYFRKALPHLKED
ncbi:MAG: CDP-diacylglycerol--glycerol-3-phosphate 3-phosphatidyltransferase [Rhodobacteraceae bacterium]|nr:CDP-diacylglycerol--glycerol-3-phosphate 3-phosphatidyltransferase [Paracoccaceae bacterium]